MNSSTQENETVPDCMSERNHAIAFEEYKTKQKDRTTEGYLRYAILIRLK
jgi:hypothetical protein